MGGIVLKTLKSLRLESIYGLFFLSYAALAICLCFILGISTTSIVLNAYNRELEEYNTALIDQYKNIIDYTAINKVDTIAARLLTGIGMDADIGHFIRYDSVDLPLVYRIHNDFKKTVNNDSRLVSALHIYSRASHNMLSSQFGLVVMNSRNDSSLDSYRWITQSYAGEGGFRWSLVWAEDESGITEEVIRLLCTYPYQSTFESAPGIIAIDMHKSFFTEIFDKINKDTSTGRNNTVVLLNEAGEIIISHGDIISPEANADTSLHWDNPFGGGFISEQGGKECFITYSSLFENNWRLAIITPVDDFYATADRIRMILTLILLGVIGIGITLAFFFSRRMFMPIRRIATEVKSLYPMESGNEYAIITRSIEALRTQVTTLNERIIENYPLLRYTLVAGILDNSIRSEALLRQRLTLIGKDIVGSFFTVLVFEISKSLGSMLSLNETHMVKYQICDLCQAIEMKDVCVVASEIGENRVVALIMSENPDLPDEFKRLADTVARQYDKQVYCGLGLSVKDPLLFSSSADSAMEALKYRFFHPGQTMFCAEKYAAFVFPENDPMQIGIDGFSKRLREGSYVNAIKDVDVFCGNLAESAYPYKYLNDCLMRFINAFSGYAKELHLDVKYTVDDFEGKFFDIEDIGEFSLWMKEAVEKTLIYRTVRLESKTDDTIAFVKIYIREHLKEDLSLAVLAGLCGISSGYLSRMFKEVTNTNLVEYITQIRLEEARRLIETTNKNIEEIAAGVGYQTTHYFSRRFKEHFGYTPSYYRFASNMSDAGNKD